MRAAPAPIAACENSFKLCSFTSEVPSLWIPRRKALREALSLLSAAKVAAPLDANILKLGANIAHVKLHLQRRSNTYQKELSTKEIIINLIESA